MAKDSVRTLLKQINFNALRACGGFGMGWGIWQAFSASGEVFFGFLAACACFGGAINLVKVLWGLACLVFGGRGLRGFRRHGAAPKTDRMADADDLKKRGLLK